MKLYTVDAEQIIFHKISVLANNENEASERVNEIIQERKAFSTSQQIHITNVKIKSTNS
jgi:rRNA maturation endonuclease Nob1